jgi:hypothetical protein
MADGRALKVFAPFGCSLPSLTCTCRAARIRLMETGGRRSSLIARLRRIGRDRYTLCDGQIVQQRGLFHRDAIDLANIVSWYVHYEMVFDCVVLSLRDGCEAVWLDYDNDLLSILGETLPHLETKAP